MAPIDDFKQFIVEAETRRADGSITPGSQFDNWVKANKGEWGRWQAYRDLVLKYETTGIIPPEPTMTTPHGRELILGAKLYLDNVYGKTPPPPDPDPVPPVVPPVVVPPVVTPPKPSGRTVLWHADFEDGTFSQWGNGRPQDSTQRDGGCGNDSWATVIDTPFVGKGTKAAQLFIGGTSVKPPGMTGGVRAQLNTTAQQTNANEGQESWFGFSLLFPSDKKLNNGPWKGWHVVQQFGGGMAFNIPHINVQDHFDGRGPVIELETYTGSSQTPKGDLHKLLAALAYDLQFDIDLFVRWSKDRTIGKVQCNVNDEIIVPLQSAQTMPTDRAGGIFQLDMYRSPNVGQAPPAGYNTTVVTSGVTAYSIP